MPDAGPLGDVFFEARFFAIVAASLVNNPSGGNVASVCTLADQRLTGLPLKEAVVRVFRELCFFRLKLVFVFLVLVGIGPFDYDAPLTSAGTGPLRFCGKGGIKRVSKPRIELFENRENSGYLPKESFCFFLPSAPQLLPFLDSRPCVGR